MAEVTDAARRHTRTFVRMPKYRDAYSAGGGLFDSLLLVCTGNICRSPMAEALFAERARIHERNMKIGSAGVAALVDHAPAESVLSLMLERGLDLAGHRARQLDVELGAQYDLLLVMEKRQMQYIERKWPELKGRVRRLGEFRKEDIPDPYGLPYRYYAACLHLIEECIGDWEFSIFGQAK